MAKKKETFLKRVQENAVPNIIKAAMVTAGAIGSRQFIVIKDIWPGAPENVEQYEPWIKVGIGIAGVVAAGGMKKGDRQKDTIAAAVEGLAMGVAVDGFISIARSMIDGLPTLGQRRIDMKVAARSNKYISVRQGILDRTRTNYNMNGYSGGNQPLEMKIANGRYSRGVC